MPVEWAGGGGGEDVGGISATVQMVGAAEFDAQVQRVEAGLKRLGATAGVVDAGMTRAGGASKNFGYQMLLVGQTVDDLQYGFSAIVNQLPQLAMAFGVGAGFAGGVAIAGVALNQFVKRWGDLTAAFGDSGVRTAAEEMELLAGKTSKTADEQKRLNELKREEQQIEEQKKRRTTEGKAVQERGGKAIAGVPYDAILRDVTDVMMKDRGAQIEAEAGRREASERAAMAQGGGRAEITPERAEEIRLEVEAEMRARNEAIARETIRGAEFGSGREQRELEELARRNPGMRDLGRAVRGFTPAERGFAPVVEGHVQARGEALLREGEREAEAEAVRKRALDADHEAAVERQAHGGGARAEREKLNQAAVDKLFREGDAADRRDEAMGKLRETHARRLSEIMAPEIRQSRVMDASQLNASVQQSVSNGPSEEARRMAEVRDEIKQFREQVRQLNQPVRAGGR